MQAIELDIISAVYDVQAECPDDLVILLYSFDGLTVRFRRQKDVARMQRRITEAVEARAMERWGVVTTLTWESLKASQGEVPAGATREEASRGGASRGGASHMSVMPGLAGVVPDVADVVPGLAGVMPGVMPGLAGVVPRLTVEQLLSLPLPDGEWRDLDTVPDGEWRSALTPLDGEWLVSTPLEFI